MARLSAAYLRQRVGAGATLAEIANEAGVSRTTVFNHCRAHGLQLQSRSGRRRKLPPDAELIARIEAGERPSDIARSSGAHPSSVHLALYRVGLRLDRGRVLKKED